MLQLCLGKGKQGKFVNHYFKVNDFKIINVTEGIFVGLQMFSLMKEIWKIDAGPENELPFGHQITAYTQC